MARSESRKAEASLTPSLAFLFIKQQLILRAMFTQGNFSSNRPMNSSMESPRRNWAKAFGAERQGHRSASNVSSSSTSSDIVVAPGPATGNSRQPSLYNGAKESGMMVRCAQAEVRARRILVVSVRGDRNRAFLAGLAENDKSTAVVDGTGSVDGSSDGNEEFRENDQDGPNRRGTYSKQYVTQHPEIKWVHRGQGRYLPSQTANLMKSERSDFDLAQVKDPVLRKKLDTWKNEFERGEFRQTRNLVIDDSVDDPIKRRASEARASSLRKRLTEARTSTSSAEDLRSARLSRRVKPVPTTELERRSSRVSTFQNYNEDEEDDDMSDEKEATYDKDHIDAHPDEKFYHTGNGWYKRGRRPQVLKNAKRRESEGHAVVRRRDGSWQFDNKQTIHVSQLENYPGVEFHHCGNGWYKPGPDSTGHRVSLIAGLDDSDEEDEDEEALNSVVSKDYTLRHPEIEWVHRGNGRYKRKSIIATPAAASDLDSEQERDQKIYSKAYVLAHPDEEFHHRGNARYMRGPPPDHWASARRRRSAPAGVVAQEDDSALYGKAYVDSHPNEEFHHRGQGRYARGPRPKMVMEDEGDESDADPDGLVDTDYVNSHPRERFHHRGQGRWARGSPPPGASNKVAVRGPGAKEMKADAASLLEAEDESNKPPPLTALVLRTEGPDQWPGLQWHYRGGGKWGRMTKQEFEDMSRGGPSRTWKGKGRMRSMDGPEAQLEREAAAADAARRVDRDDGFQIPGEMGDGGLQSLGRPKIKRRRMNKRGSFQTQEDGLASKQSSHSQPRAPVPKPRMLLPEEDTLTEDDLPQLYRDDWSPESEKIDDGADRLLRKMKRINPPEKFVKALTKHDPAVRPLDNLKRLAGNAQVALDQLQKEYLELDKITAPHARIPRRPAKGGRLPVDPMVFEDKKEADLYDYAYDPRRIGYQDPQAQKVQRDVEGRELRGRRNRSGAYADGPLPGWNFGQDDNLAAKRAVKPVNRFDGIVAPARKRARNSTAATSKAASMTPDIAGTPRPANGYAPAASGRWAGHIPKRIRQLREESTGGVSLRREGSPGGIARKGRPPGSKNLHKRRDAGIKKGPRKPRAVESIEGALGSGGEGEGEGDF